PLLTRPGFVAASRCGVPAPSEPTRARGEPERDLPGARIPVPVISKHVGRVKSSRLTACSLLCGPTEAAGGGYQGIGSGHERGPRAKARCVITEWPCASHLFGRRLAHDV